MTSPDTLTARQLGRATLARQLLLERERLPVVDAVGRVGGLQAQEAKPPFVGLWSRLDGFEREQLRDALERRDVVRATAMRATLHLLTAADYAAVRASLHPVLAAGAERILRARGQDFDVEPVLAVARRLLTKRPLTFNELRPLLVERFPDAEERSLGYAVRTHLPLVMVPTDDPWAFASDSAFTLADSWLDGSVSKDASPRALVRRYLAAFGPATATDVQAWSGLTGLKPVLEDLRDELAVFRDERKRVLFDLPDAPRPDPDTPAPPRLLPDFDSLVLAHDDRTRVVPDEHRGALVTKNLRVKATFLVDGLVAGTWSVERKRGTATLTLAPFARLAKGARDELAAEAEALLAFTEGPEAKAKVAVTR